MGNKSSLTPRTLLGALLIVITIAGWIVSCGLASAARDGAEELDVALNNAITTANDGTASIEELKTSTDDTLNPILDDLDNPENGLLVVDFPKLLDDVADGLANAQTGIEDSRDVLPRVIEFLENDFNDYVAEFDKQLDDIETTYLVDAIAEARQASGRGEEEAPDILVFTEDALDDVEEELLATDVSFEDETITAADLRLLADEADAEDTGIDTEFLRNLADRMEEDDVTLTVISLGEGFSEARSYIDTFREDYPEFFREVNSLIDDVDLNAVDSIAQAREYRAEVLEQRDMLVEELTTAHGSIGTSGEDLLTISLDVRDQKETVEEFVPHIESVRTYRDDVYEVIDETVANVNTTTASVENAEIVATTRNIINWVMWLLIVVVAIPGAFGVYLVYSERRRQQEATSEA